MKLITNNRLLKLENQQKLQLSTITNSINTGSYKNLESIAHRLMIQQRDRENIQDFMEEKLKNIVDINNKYNRNLNNTILLNNRYFNNGIHYINNQSNNNNYKNNDYFG